jgi:emp24/gp25L/p24 family/GOLD
MQGEKERQGDFVFTAQELGEYRFCFNNEISTFTEKVIDFEIAVRQPPTNASPYCSGSN